MTHRIPKSQIQLSHDLFHKAVEAHIAELEAWTKHMVAVVAWDKYKSTLPPGELSSPNAPVETHKYPPPQTHPHIEASIRMESLDDGTNVKFTPDYEIFDDGPTPAEILQNKKHDLLVEATTAERVAIHAILPQTKARLLDIRYRDIQAKAEELRTQEEELRTQEDLAFIKEHEDKRKQLDEVQRKFAQIQSDIEDLTIENIDSYKLSEE